MHVLEFWLQSMHLKLNKKKLRIQNIANILGFHWKQLVNVSKFLGTAEKETSLFNKSTFKVITRIHRLFKNNLIKQLLKGLVE